MKQKKLENIKIADPAVHFFRHFTKNFSFAKRVSLKNLFTVI